MLEPVYHGRVVKTFRVVLSVGGVIFVQADRFQEEGSLFRFYRGDSTVAEYPCVSIKEEITVTTPTQQIGLYERGAAGGLKP